MSFPQERKGKFAKEKKQKRRGYTKKPTRTNDQKRLSILKYLYDHTSSTKKEICKNCSIELYKDATLLKNLVSIKWLELIPDNPNVEYRITDKGKEIISLFEQIKNEIDSENEPLFDFFKNYNKFEDD